MTPVEGFVRSHCLHLPGLVDFLVSCALDFMVVCL